MVGWREKGKEGGSWRGTGGQADSWAFIHAGPGGISLLASPAPEYAAALMGKGCEQKQAGIKFGVSYLHPAVGKEEGAPLSLFVQVRARLNIFPAS